MKHFFIFKFHSKKSFDCTVECGRLSSKASSADICGRKGKFLEEIIQFFFEICEFFPEFIELFNELFIDFGHFFREFLEKKKNFVV